MSYRDAFATCFEPLLVLLIVLIAADFPVPRHEGFLAFGLVFLSGERCLVGSDLRQIGLTGGHHRTHFRKADTSCQLTCGGRTLALLVLTDIPPVAIRGFRRCCSVPTV